MNYSMKLIDKAKSYEHKIYKRIESIDLRISVIIPITTLNNTYYIIEHICSMDFIYEIIIVDDSGNKSNSWYEYYKNFKKVKYIKHKRNLGAGAARNTGSVFANGNILLFLDQDMIVNELMIRDIINKYKKETKLLFLGTRNDVKNINVNIKSMFKNLQNLDWRIKTQINSDFIDLTLLNKGTFNPTNNNISVYYDTNKFKNLTIDSCYYCWDLPSIVISHSLAIEKEMFFYVGGFPEWTKGWGAEDIAFGFLCVCAGLSIYLSRNPSLHISHVPHSGSRQKQFNELRHNLFTYRAWANKLNLFPRIDINDVYNRVVKILI